MKILRNELVMLWDVTCPKCGSEILNKNGKYRSRQRFICLDCGHSFTTYSKSVLDSTKLSETVWKEIIRGIINEKTLKSMSDDTDVSQISISKIRRNILNVLYPLNRFTKELREYFYDPEETSSYFIPDREDKIVYYLEYRKDLMIVFMRYHKHMFVSDALEKEKLNHLMDCGYYPRLTFLPMDDNDDPEADEYMTGLVAFLKTFRGLKYDLIGKYCNLYDFKRYLSDDELYQLIVSEISKYKKGNG